MNCLAEVGYNVSAEAPFKGNFDLNLLEEEIKKDKKKAALILVTITCNNNGGQPVSMENIRGVRAIADKYGIPMFFDACLLYTSRCV